MKKIAHFIVNHRKLIILSYAVMIILSLIGIKLTSIEYDLSSYLPKEMNSIKGKNVLRDHFNINGTATLMLKEVDLYKVQKIKNDIKALPGVKDVIWLDSVEDINKPKEFFDKKLSDRFIIGDYNLFQIQLIEGNDTLNTRKTLDAIDKLVPVEHNLGGAAATSKDMQDTAGREMIYYSIAAFIIITIILLMSSSAYYEPILFFATIGTAIALNMGTNIIFGKISSNTHSVASILQLAVSMDYSIFLMHRYLEELNEKNHKEAMAHAIEKTFSAVSSSALTTICGFLALLIMKYGIGRDMGLVLAKGVLLSLISVISLMPCLVLSTEKRFSKYKHKILLPNFNKSAKHLVRFRYVVIIIAVILTLPSFLGQSKLNYYYSTEKTLSDTSSSVLANNKIQEVFGKSNELILIVPKSDNIKIKSLINDAKTIENIDSIEGLYSMVDETLPDFLIPQDIRKTFESEKYTYFIVNLKSSVESNETTAAITELRKVTANYFDDWYLTGEAPVYLDLKQVTSSDFNNVNIISVILIGLVLVITFKSIMLPIILVFVIQLGIWINLSIPYFQGSDLNFISFIIIGSISLGATVDYAILVTSRYKENLLNYPPLEAMIKTIKETGRAVMTSALILMAGTLSVSLITTIRSASELTLLIGRGAFISLVLVFALLPALLLVFNSFIKYTTIGWPGSTKSTEKKLEL